MMSNRDRALQVAAVLSLVLNYVQAQAVRTVTLYDVGSGGFITSNVSISPEGVDPQGGTIYSFEELKTVTTTVNGVPTETLSEVWAGTMVEDASREILTILPTAPGGRGAIASCTYRPDGQGACLWEEWISGGSTIAYTFADSAYPFYTLTLTSNSTPTSVSAGAVTSSSSSGTIMFSSSSGRTSRSHISIGPIIGGILGGVAVLAFSLLCLLYRHRHRRRANSTDLSKMEKRELNASGPGDNSASPTLSPLPGDEPLHSTQVAEENPEDTTRLVHTREGIQMVYAGPQDSISTLDDSNPKALMFRRKTEARQEQSTPEQTNSPVVSSSSGDASVTRSSPNSPLLAQTEPPSQPEGVARDNSDLRPQLEALRAEVELLRAQQLMTGYDMPPPQYTT